MLVFGLFLGFLAGKMLLAGATSMSVSPCLGADMADPPFCQDELPCEFVFVAVSYPKARRLPLLQQLVGLVVTIGSRRFISVFKGSTARSLLRNINVLAFLVSFTCFEFKGCGCRREALQLFCLPGISTRCEFDLAENFAKMSFDSSQSFSYVSIVFWSNMSRKQSSWL